MALIVVSRFFRCSTRRHYHQRRVFLTSTLNEVLERKRSKCVDEYVITERLSSASSDKSSLARTPLVEIVESESELDI